MPATDVAPLAPAPLDAEELAAIVTNDARSEHSHSTDSAISSGVPIRPIGSSAVNCASASRLAATMRSTIGVLITPGQTASTRIPASAYSSAVARVSSMTPPLETQ